MSSKLEKLLTYYEAERASLTAELEACTAEQDYARVQLFSKALGRLSQQLQTLYSLKDKWHIEKEYLAHSIELLGRRAVLEEEYRLHYITERVAKEEKLVELQRDSTQKAPASHSVRDALNSLLSGEITGFTLVLKNSKKLYCHARLVKKTLILSVPEMRRHTASYTLQKRQVKQFKLLGFSWYDNKDKLMLFAPYTTSKEVQAVQRILARMAFEVFYFKELAGETFIRYPQTS